MSQQIPDTAPHIPVLKDEVIAALNLKPNSLVVDATYGRGGHARSILSRLGNDGRMLVIDRDPQAIAEATIEWSEDDRVEIVHAPFSCLATALGERNLSGRVTGLLFDFGVSSPQLDNAERGFSFSHDGPLDMRMDPTLGQSAAEWIKEVEESELVYVLKKFGEERFAKKIAARIKAYIQETGAMNTTSELANLVSSTIGSREPGKHPATRTFQAIRIAVNQEIEEIESVLPQAINVLDAGGRLVIISFHSLEDRPVKRFLREQSKGDSYPPDMPVTADMLSPKIKLIGRAVHATDEEIKSNRRSRSAVMRVAEKLESKEFAGCSHE